ncbi:PTS transporter subunit IIC [Enterococcus hulanensis]|uniref:PTS galactitol transporter subunit IIC n=1 Tax=Enterococcus hulanensis TaxID=2559929 RepID=UPI00288E6B46|nr:PTS transporter subunit IIC [Enterococcus hulanensis]MDT2659789.1 PTS transporter subunit IIC [Enterococcus hulanensis]
MHFIQLILDLGASVMMPLIILLLGLVVRMKPIKALRAGLTVGVGFIGINLITGTMGGYMTPIIEGLQKQWSLSLDTYDMGWPVSSGIAFSNGQFVVMMFIVLIAVNLLMLSIKATDTLNVDIWNFWHFIMGGSLVYVLTDNIIMGCITGGLYGAIVLLLTDKHAERIKDFLGYPGITITTQSFPLTLYVCIWIDKLLDKIPGINKIKFSLSSLNPKIAFLGEPLFLGFILGFILPLISNLGIETALSTGVGMASVMFILPRMVKILMEGLSPLSTAAQEYMSKKFPGRKINIGMDLAVLLGDKEIITLSMLMVPITLLLAVVLPGNKVLPFTDLPALTYFMTAPVIAAKRNSFRSLLIGIIVIISMLYIATDLAPLFTSIGHSSGLVDADATSVSALSSGGEVIAWIIVKIVSLFS